ncbi:MAG: hypothetical protein RML12_08150 [Xanthomonadales bacterium]|nr:hypothetical protein [Xanthomonadales bacterium]
MEVEMQPLLPRSVPTGAQRLEDPTPFHAVGVDVERNRGFLPRGVADEVVLVRGDQAAGGAGDRVDHAARFQLHQPVALGDALEGDDLEGAMADALHAPQPAVVVDARALQRSPGHGDQAVAQRGAAVEFAARVVLGMRPEHLGGQPELGAADRGTEQRAQRRRDPLGLPQRDRGVHRRDQPARGGFRRPALAPPGHARSVGQGRAGSQGPQPRPARNSATGGPKRW